MNSHPPRNGIMGVSGYTAFPEIGRPQPVTAAPALTLERSLRIRRKRKVDFMDFMFPPLQQAEMIAGDLMDYTAVNYHENPCRDIVPRRVPISYYAQTGKLGGPLVPTAYCDLVEMNRGFLAAMARRHLAKYCADDIDLAAATFNLERDERAAAECAEKIEKRRAFLAEVGRFRERNQIPADDEKTAALRKLSYAQKKIAAHAAASVRDAEGGGGDQEKNR